MSNFFINLIATLFLYLIFPVCYRIKKGKTSSKTATKISLINSAVCLGVVLLISFILERVPQGNLLVTPIFYYFINKILLTDKSVKSNNAPPDCNDTQNTDDNTQNSDDTEDNNDDTNYKF